MFYNQILRHTSDGDSYAEQHRYGEAITAYKQARGGIRTLSQLDVKAEGLMMKLTVNIVSCMLQENKRDLSILDWATLHELSGECFEVASKVQNEQLKKLNQKNFHALEHAILVKGYNEAIDLFQRIEWDLLVSINAYFDFAVHQLSASETRYRNAGYKKDADEVYAIISKAYLQKGEALFNITADVCDPKIIRNLLSASWESYKMALQRGYKPSNKAVLTLLKIGYELNQFLPDGEEKQQLRAEREHICQHYK